MTPLKGHISEPGNAIATPPGRSLPEPAAIRVQLERLLASPHFRTSKRCQSLLTHVVEAYLEGTLDRVKERVIGCEVFGRDAGYDTNQDSVVRTTAGEVRKRLAQYYLESGHEHELRFLLPPGSYVPEFRVPPPAPVSPLPVLPLPTPAPPPEPVSVPPVPQRASAKWPWATAAMAVIVAGLWTFLHFRPTELESFWKPLLDDPADVILCIEQPLRIYAFDGARVDDLNGKMVGTATTPAASAKTLQDTTLSLAELKAIGNRYFSFGDTIATVRVAEFLARKGKPFQVLGDRAASFRDLRGRPAVLIGEFNNQWTNGLIRGLRFYLEKNAENRTYEVRDREQAGKVIASVSREAGRPAEYAVVSRVFDASTEKTVIAVAGMTYAGTGSVGDFLSNQSYMRAAFGKAPAGWQRKNIQVVLETTLVGGIPGPPKVLATHFW